MAKITNEHLNDHNLNVSDDVLEDIEPGDYVFVVSQHGDLKGISLLYASDAGKHITGQWLAVDGGVSCISGG